MKEKILAILSRINRPGMPELIEWLKNTDFFTAPASVKHHCNYETGLAQHSWHVYNLFCEKLERFNINLSADSAAICGLLHDACKINFYKWNEKYKKYTYDDEFPIGHGDKSVIILQRFIKLTDEEAAIIKWHMSSMDMSFYEKPAYYKALEKWPHVLLLFTADYEATVLLEKTLPVPNNNSSPKPELDMPKEE